MKRRVLFARPGRRAFVRGGRAGHLPRRQDGVVRRDGVGGRTVGCSSPDAQKDILCDTIGAICSATLFLQRKEIYTMKRNKIVKFVTWGIVSALVAWGASAIAVYAVSSGRVFDSASMDAVPRRRAAVVMGCVRTLSNGLNNLYFSQIGRASCRERV